MFANPVMRKSAALIFSSKSNLVEEYRYHEAFSTKQKSEVMAVFHLEKRLGVQFVCCKVPHEILG